MACHIPSIIAGSFMLVGNLLGALYFFALATRDGLDRDLYEDLDPTYLDAEWAFRIKQRALFLSAGFVTSIGWLFFAYAIVQLSWILSWQGTKSITLSITSMVLAGAGAMTQWLAFLFFFGATAAEEILFKKFNLQDWVRDDIDVQDADGMGLRVLEISHVTYSGFFSYVSNIGWAFLTVILLCIFFGVKEWRKDDVTAIGARWNALTLFIGLLCGLDFIVGAVLYEKVEYAKIIYGLYTLILRVFLLPAWVLSLGFVLPAANLMTNTSSIDPLASELQLTEVAPAGAAAPQFTIGDEDNEPMVPASPPAEAFAQNIATEPAPADS